MRKTIFPLPLWALVIILFFCWPTIVFGIPLYASEGDGVRIVLTDEPCALKEIVINLPMRATWTERGKVYEGCWGLSPARVVTGYFSDKTVVAMPVQMFQRVQGA